MSTDSSPTEILQHAKSVFDLPAGVQRNVASEQLAQDFRLLALDQTAFRNAMADMTAASMKDPTLPTITASDWNNDTKQITVSAGKEDALKAAGPDSFVLPIKSFDVREDAIRLAQAHRDNLLGKTENVDPITAAYLQSNLDHERQYIGRAGQWPRIGAYLRSAGDLPINLQVSRTPAPNFLSYTFGPINGHYESETIPTKWPPLVRWGEHH